MIVMASCSERNGLPQVSRLSSFVRASTGFNPRPISASYTSSMSRPSAAVTSASGAAGCSSPAGLRRPLAFFSTTASGVPSAGGVLRTRNGVTFRFSEMTICSAVVAPMPGSVDSHRASCRLIASAISLTGRAIALSAFFTPIFSTVQNRSKKSSSASVLKPMRRGMNRLPEELPSKYSEMWNVISVPTRS